VGSALLAEHSTLSVRLADNSQPSNDSIHASGPVTLDGATLLLSPGGAMQTGQTFTLISASGGVTGSFAQLPDQSLFVAGGTRFLIAYLPNSVTVTVTQLPLTIVAVAGSDGQLYMSADGGPFSLKGGHIIAAPAVALVPQAGGGYSPIIVATGSDHRLWVKNSSSAWTELAPTSTYCIDNPAIYVDGPAASATFHISCIGSDHALWYGFAPISGTEVPQVSTFTSWGGRSNYGVALVMMEGEPTVFVVGTDTQIWTRTVSRAWSPMLGTHCTGHPSASSPADTTFLGCHGGDDALWYTVDTDAGFGPWHGAGGRLVDGPGIAAQGDRAVAVAQGTDGRLWSTSLSATAASSFEVYGGKSLFGTSATSAMG
jgi:hypothetical protein